VSDLRAVGLIDFAIDGERGRHIRATPKLSGIMALRALRSRGYQPDCFVIALGTNDVFVSGNAATYRIWIEAMLNEIGDHPVLWVDIVNGKKVAAAATFNSTLRDVAATHPQLVIGEWASFAALHPEWTGRDKIHLKPAGYLGRASWLTEQVVQELYHGTVPALGATCPVPVTVRLGQTNDSVLCLETRLTQLGFDVGTPDRRFNLATARAVAKFQRWHWRPPSGRADALTRQLLGLETT